MPPKSIWLCPEYQKIMTSSWELSTPSLVSNEELLQPSSVWMCFYIQRLLYCIPLSLCFSGVLSVLGNGILLFVAYRKKSSLKPAEFFVVNLAISDLSMTITLFPLAIPSAYAHMWVTIKVFIAPSHIHYATVFNILLRDRVKAQRDYSVRQACVFTKDTPVTSLLLMDKQGWVIILNWSIQVSHCHIDFFFIVFCE